MSFQVSPAVLYSMNKGVYLTHGTEAACKVYSVSFLSAPIRCFYKIEDEYYLFRLDQPIEQVQGKVSVYPNALTEVPLLEEAESATLTLKNAKFRKATEKGALPKGILDYFKLVGCEEMPPLPIHLDPLNAILQEKCRNARIEVGYRVIMKNIITNEYASEMSLTICLYVDDVGVSTIELGLEKQVLVLDYSSTHREHSGKKYNKMMRAVAYVMAAQLGFKSLDSFAINAVSAYVLIKYFRGGFKEIMEGHGPFEADSPTLLKDIQTYYEAAPESKDITCPVTEDFYHKLMQSGFAKFVDEITCDRKRRSE